MELIGQYLEADPTLTNGQLAVARLTIDQKLMIDSAVGSATAAKQDQQTALLTTIDADTGNIATNTSTIAGKDFATETTLSSLNAKFPSASVFSNAGANSTLNIKASAGALYSFYCKNINAASRYIQFWNSATDATAGSNLIEFEVPTLSTLIVGSDFFLQNGLAFSTGIAFGFSSTSGTYTAATASDMRLLVRYL